MPVSNSQDTHWLPSGMFLPGSNDEWKDLIIKELKGISYDTLQSQTEDGILLNPTYTREVEKTIPYFSDSAWFNFLRNINPPNLRTFQPDTNIFDQEKESNFSTDTLCLSIADFGSTPKQLFLPNSSYWIDMRFPYQTDKVEQLLQAGNKGFGRWDLAGVPMHTQWPADFSPYAFRADLYHHQGSNGTQEIAWVLHDLVQWLHEWTDKGFGVEQAQSLIHFRFSLGTDLMGSVSKIRAFRGLYFLLMKQYGIENPLQPQILTDASLRYYSSLDSYNNVLRAGTGAFAALSSGCTTFEIHPFSSSGSEETGNRLGRNLIRLLKEESQVGRTADPLGGAWALESYTWQLMQEAEKLLQNTEAQGNLADSYKKNILEQTRFQLSQSFNKGKTRLIGVNYQAARYSVAPNVFSFQGLPQPLFRLAEPFELLQSAAQSLPGYSIEFLCPEKLCQARADFIRQFMAVCGLYQTNDQSALCIVCGKDEDYTTQETLDKIRNLSKELPLVLAGKPAEGMELLKEAGIRDFIQINSDRIALGKSLHQWMQQA
jgi:methylmalonyl-CoA mutase